MIVRIWHGWTRPGNAEAYEALLRTEILPEIAARAGADFRGAELLRRDAGAEVEFVTLLRFESMDAARAFVGDDPERAHVPDRARELLERFEERVAHYESRMRGPGQS